MIKNPNFLKIGFLLYFADRNFGQKFFNIGLCEFIVHLYHLKEL